MNLDRLSMMALVAAAIVSLASTCNVFVEEEGEGEGERPAWRDESAGEQMEEEQMDEVEERIER